jgi:outer membrane protein assembly factor BamD (BamD/ComL family)
MKELTLFLVLSFVFTYTAGQFGLWERFHERATTVHNYEYKALELAKEMRQLKVENTNLKSKISALQAKKQHLEMSLAQKGGRTVASIYQPKANDMVQFELYQWGPEKLLGVAQQALHFKKWEKAAQYYNALTIHYPNSKLVNDEVLFEAGIAAYESKQHYDWSKKHFKNLISQYPSKRRSKYFRGAKLFLALSNFYLGDQDKFIATVNEFHQKYRNSQEYTLLSKYYNDLALKYDKKRR